MSLNWTEYLQFSNNLDGILRLVFVIAVVILIVANSFVFEEPYAVKLAELHTQPWWRILLAVALILATVWCPRVGIVVALLVFLYLSDVEMLTKPFVKIM
ncbi:MAG: hypothetical protein EBT86_08735 [Actinobacteria bacterium]|nr:hypothetical protein [Actinomycetota bacterium]